MTLIFGSFVLEPGSEPNKFAYLCPDGTVKPLGDLSAISAPCAWASRPWPGVLSAISGHQQALRDALQNLVTAATAASRFDLIKSVITLGDNVTMIPVDPIEPGRYLEEGMLIYILVYCILKYGHIQFRSEHSEF